MPQPQPEVSPHYRRPADILTLDDTIRALQRGTFAERVTESALWWLLELDELAPGQKDR